MGSTAGSTTMTGISSRARTMVAAKDTRLEVSSYHVAARSIYQRYAPWPRVITLSLLTSLPNPPLTLAASTRTPKRSASTMPSSSSLRPDLPHNQTQMAQRLPPLYRRILRRRFHSHHSHLPARIQTRLLPTHPEVLTTWPTSLMLSIYHPACLSNAGR